jgi:hypothetical protein
MLSSIHIEGRSLDIHRARSIVLIVAVPRLFGIVATLPAQTTTIRKVDFKNSTYAWDDPSWNEVPNTWHWIKSAPRSSVTLSNGVYDFSEPQQEAPPPLLSFESLTSGDLIGDGNEQAVAVLSYSTGGTARRVGDCCSEGYIRVRYKWRKGSFVETGAREKGDVAQTVHASPSH